MKGVVFDRPEVFRVAEEFIAEYDMCDRFSVREKLPVPCVGQVL